MKNHYGYFTNTTGNGKDGDAVDVFHVGFLILKPGEKPLFRHASQISGKVIDQTLESYLEKSKKKIPGIVQFEFLGN